MTEAEDEFSQRLRNALPNLPPTLRRIAVHFDRNRIEILPQSAIEVAQSLGTSDASVIRAAKALGYDGLPDLKRGMTKSMGSAAPADGFRRALEQSHSDARLAAEQSLDTQRGQLAEAFGPTEMQTLHLIAQMLSKTGRIVLFGLGPTAHIVGYGAHLMRRHGRNVAVLDQPGNGLADQMLSLHPGDGLLIFAYGQPYGELEVLVSEASRLSLPVALVTDASSSQMSRGIDLVARVPRGEAEGMSLHGATVVWLEALIVSLSVMGSAGASEGLARLARLRTELAARTR